MLGRADKGLAVISWVAASIAVIMLLFGPALVAHDSAGTPSIYSVPGTSAPPSGKALFVSNCGSCHTLSAAGTSGAIGPNLDQLSLSAPQVAAQVRSGGGSMPAFAGTLTAAEIQAVASFVAASHH
jgi:mono/diheme cytochrome c family protein